METKHETPVDIFIEYHRKICWEAEYEKGEYCIGENKVRKFYADLLAKVSEQSQRIQELADSLKHAQESGLESAVRNAQLEEALREAKSAAECILDPLDEEELTQPVFEQLSVSNKKIEALLTPKQ